MSSFVPINNLPVSPKVLKIGLTGGIASGKSTAATLFEAMGVPIIDADIVSREVVEPGEEGLNSIINTFGHEVLTDTGSLDRRKLRDIVFTDEKQRKKLESILHPIIRQRMTEYVEQHEQAAYVVLVIPLMFETGQHEIADRILLIDCTIEEQITRVMTRDNISKEQAKKILDSQATREQRQSIADDIVLNNSNSDDLARSIEELHKNYLELAKFVTN